MEANHHETIVRDEAEAEALLLAVRVDEAELQQLISEGNNDSKVAQLSVTIDQLLDRVAQIEDDLDRETLIAIDQTESDFVNTNSIQLRTG